MTTRRAFSAPVILLAAFAVIAGGGTVRAQTPHGASPPDGANSPLVPATTATAARKTGPLSVKAPGLTQPPPAIPAPPPKVLVLGDLKAPLPKSATIDVSADVKRPLDLAIDKSMPVTLPRAAHDIVVGSPDIVNVLVRSPRLIYVVGRAVGQTNIFFRDRRGRTIGEVAVNVHLDTGALRRALAAILPDDTGIRVTGLGDSIVLSGNVRNNAAAASAARLARQFVKQGRNVVNLMRVSDSDEVLLRVKVAEVAKTALKELGVGPYMSGVGNIGKMSVSASPYQPRANNSIYQTFGSGALTSAASAFTSLTFGAGQLFTTFTMLENQNLVKTLEEPNLTAVSGETATMLAGGEFPVPVSENNGSIAVSYKNFGVGLAFTPVVLDAGHISLKMKTEVSTIDRTLAVNTGGVTVYGLKVRRAGSVVDLPSGGSIMIAGLLQNDIASVASGFPGLMDVPVLGRLFRSNSFQHGQSELVVVVSAFIVHPVDNGELNVSTDGFAPSSDVDRFLFNRLQTVYLRKQALPPIPPQLKGPIGYIVE